MWSDPSPLLRKLLLAAGCTMNVGILVYFKYTGFILENCNFFLGTSFEKFSILLPLGISFYTFQQLSFLIDTYSGKNGRINCVDYSLFVTFFPQLIAGPIVLPGEMLPQFNDSSRQKICWDNMNSGLFLFACGLVKKCFLADTVAVMADTGFNSTTPLNLSEAWLVSLSFSFQLYFDFSGYCDMAMGIGKFFNIDLPLNFNSPYKSTDFQSFWRKWHITLGRFMMNYLYIPLGGNKCGMARTLCNLLIVFVLSGIWHGAGWLFLLWGGLHGLCILINRVWSKTVVKHHPALQLPKIPAIILTFFLVNIFWVFFRATTLQRACSIIRSMFDFTNAHWITKAFRRAMEEHGFEKDFIFAVFIMAVVFVFFLPNSFEMSKKLQEHPRWRAVLTVLFAVIGFLCVGRYSPFLYFNF
jgi:alginate O-acetyltransferase complex protein AlgI